MKRPISDSKEQGDFCDHCGTRAKRASGLIVVETAPTEDFHAYIKRCGFNVHVFQDERRRYFATLLRGNEQVYGTFEWGMESWKTAPYQSTLLVGDDSKEGALASLCYAITNEATPFVYIKKRWWPMKDVVKWFPPTGRLVIHDPLAQ